MNTQWPGRGPWEEVWFLELLLEDGTGLWIRHTIADGPAACSGVWAVRFGRDGVRGFKSERSVAEVSHGAGVLFQREDATLTHTRATGRAGPVRWDLTLRGGGTHRHVPALLQRAGLGRTYEPAILDLVVQGHASVDGRPLRIDGARGVLGHIFGKRNRVHTWVWCHAAGFDAAQDVIFEGLAARVGGPNAPPLTSLLFATPDHTWRASDLTHLLTTRSVWGGDRWHAVARDGDATLRVVTTLAPTQALAAYRDQDGRPSWCRNSKHARVVVHVRDPARGVDRTWVTSRASAEIGTRERPSGIVTV